MLGGFCTVSQGVIEIDLGATGVGLPLSTRFALKFKLFCSPWPALQKLRAVVS
jgi:hypothetical protein